MNRLGAVIVAIAVLVVAAVGITIGLARCSTGTSSANIARCQQNLRQLGRSLQLFAHDHHGKYPESLQELVNSNDAEPSNLSCPNALNNPAYIYLNPAVSAATNQSTVIVIEPLQDHPNGANALHLDGTVTFLDLQHASLILNDRKESELDAKSPIHSLWLRKGRARMHVAYGGVQVTCAPF